ncbi:aspartate/methionine/tyrosine aminotransferase [Blastomonas natatoria]|uniref:Aspartate/methionine/tyrosine aminotransferase n=1 Tax=Blastomonas natatoria TaxID=34015 RepID=A0A2V3UT54_9SPHN|nr:aminotransferase [Blastomonas natatoria]PXW71559.1 aspartate/methionine/tyrosine aminotransferase [Blastomonas natatoria]
MNPIYRDMPTTIFEAMSMRARETGAINLGQGFPDGPINQQVIVMACDAMHHRSNQYPPMVGLPELREAVAGWYARHQALDLNPAEVVVTSGATEAIAAALLALISPGDEVLLFQPLYDAYLPLVQRAGGTARIVDMDRTRWRIDRDSLASAIGPRTRLLVFNDPMNPMSTCAHPDDLALLARTCLDHDLIAVCDEVWEALVYDGAPHRSLMQQPGMRERTVKIGSAGKIFGLTGWKLGWMCAAPPIARVLAKAHQFLTFTSPPHLQWAVAEGLDTQDAWIAAARDEHQASRDFFCAGLQALGLATLPSAATYFVTVDLAASGLVLDDIAFCEQILARAGVAAIPISAFYAESAPTHLVRFCFAKHRSTLQTALDGLARALPVLR